MRLLGYALALVVCLCSLADSKPKQKTPKNAPTAPAAPGQGKQPTKAQADEIRKLEQELTQHQVSQANFAALKVAKKLLDLQKQATGEDSLEFERRKSQVASLMQLTGDYTGAEKIFTELLKAAEKRHGPESREVLYALMPLGGVYWGQSRYEDAEPIAQRQIALTKKLDGEKSVQYATQLSMLGALLNVRNEYSAAQRVYEQALQVHESIAASKNDITLLSPLQSLASIYWQTNQQAKAIALYDRVIQIANNAPNTNLMTKVGTMWGVAAAYSYGGRKDLAMPLMKKTIDMAEKEIVAIEKKNPDDYTLPGILGMTGYMYQQAGDLANAEKTFMKTIAWSEKRKQPSGYEASLAFLKREQGKPKDALALLEKAKAAMAKHPLTATAYDTTIADVLRDLGEYKRAEKLLDEHRASVIKNYGKKHPMYGATQLSSASIYAAAGKVAQAEKYLDEALDIYERELATVLRAGTDTDHAVYFGRNAYVLDTALNFQMKLAPTSNAASRIALTTLLRRKGRILDAAAAALATIRSKLSPDDKKILDELNSARAQLAKLVNAGPSATGGGGDYAKEVAELEDKVQKLELQIAKKSAAYRTVTQPIELSAIQKVIPSDARLVEIVNYQPYDPNAPYHQRIQAKARHYAAYIIGPKGDPAVVDLGDAAAIDKAIEAFRKAVADPDNDRAVDLGRALYDLTMAKVVPKLGGSTNVLLAPDGALNVVPFSALVDDKKEFLLKKYTFTYLTSGRDLLRLTARTKAQGGGVVFADPKFDSSDQPAPAADKKTRGRRSADLASLKWPQLPGTAAEADALMKTFKGLKIYRGDQATEGALKSIKAPKILHLATHGFFLPDAAPPPEAGDARGGGGGPAPQKPAGTEVYENPLLRSGLALAGANKLSSGTDDGVLTALEASGLDLWGTKMVVLSACETGVGKVTNGDGVYGLRRALVIAGAESLVMSLWQVDDIATKDLMAGFYKKLAEGKPRSAALRETQLEIAAKEKYAHPFYWASFLPAGALTPLKD